MKICSLGGLVLQMMRTVKLDRFFEIYPDIERARLMFRAAEEA